MDVSLEDDTCPYFAAKDSRIFESRIIMNCLDSLMIGFSIIINSSVVKKEKEIKCCLEKVKLSRCDSVKLTLMTLNQKALRHTRHIVIQLSIMSTSQLEYSN